MPRPERAPLGAPCWIDVSTADEAATRSFYAELFGWEPQPGDPNYGGYSMWTVGGVPVAGCAPGWAGGGAAGGGGAGSNGGWTVYLACADVPAAIAAGGAAGGEVLAPAIDIGDQGTMAVAAGPGGDRVGLWQAGVFPGFTTVGEPGAPCWFELRTSAYDADLAWLRSVFGWEIHALADSPGFRSSQMVVGGQPFAGVLERAEGGEGGEGGGIGGSGWLVLFGAADTDATVGRAVGLGASVVRPPFDTPYGRQAEIVDPAGARLALVAVDGAAAPAPAPAG